jgi:hypothetical protein
MALSRVIKSGPARQEDKTLQNLAEQDVWAQAFWRDRLGAAVLAQDIWAPVRLGAGHIGAAVWARPFEWKYFTAVHVMNLKRLVGQMTCIACIHSLNENSS